MRGCATSAASPLELIFAFAILTLIITMSLAAFVGVRAASNRQARSFSYQALANEAEYRRRID
jgi:hypothetical protein